jgi:hypothetical protein
MDVRVHLPASELLQIEGNEEVASGAQLPRKCHPVPADLKPVVFPLRQLRRERQLDEAREWRSRHSICDRREQKSGRTIARVQTTDANEMVLSQR